MAGLKELRDLGIKNINYLSKGRRGVIYTGLYKGKKVAIKTKKKESKAKARIENEYKTLKLLNKYNIGPKVIKLSRGKTERTTSMIYYFVEGVFILDYLKNEKSKKRIKLLLKKIFLQLYKLDKLGINKEEMHHPLKHLLIKNNTPVLIDFERAYKVKKPHNVTQFLQFIRNTAGLLKRKGLRVNRKTLITKARQYKNNQTKANLDRIINHL